MKAAVVIPVLNARKYWPAFAPALLQNIDAADISPERVLVIDSSSEDGSAELAANCGFRVHRISRVDFDHGTTRQLGVGLVPDCGLIVLLTQDAILAERQSISRLLAAFAEPSIGMAYGRQLPRIGAGAIESHARLFNYSENSCVRGIESRESLGFKSVFCSDSFAAYRRDALESVGGFTSGTDLR